MPQKKDITDYLNNWINTSIKIPTDSIFDKKLLEDLLKYKPSSKEVPEALTRTVLFEKVNNCEKSTWEYAVKHLGEKNYIDLYESTFFALYASEFLKR